MRRILSHCRAMKTRGYSAMKANNFHFGLYAFYALTLLANALVRDTLTAIVIIVAAINIFLLAFQLWDIRRYPAGF